MLGTRVGVDAGVGVGVGSWRRFRPFLLHHCEAIWINVASGHVHVFGIGVGLGPWIGIIT